MTYLEAVALYGLSRQHPRQHLVDEVADRLAEGCAAFGALVDSRANHAPGRLFDVDVALRRAENDLRSMSSIPDAEIRTVVVRLVEAWLSAAPVGVTLDEFKSMWPAL